MTYIGGREDFLKRIPRILTKDPGTAKGVESENLWQKPQRSEHAKLNVLKATKMHDSIVTPSI